MGPLNGYTVIELAGIGPAPMGGMMLADHGGGGDPHRPRWRTDPRVTERVSGRGKKSVVLNLKDAQGVDDAAAHGRERR
jgi:alpha-methylacyl-CoA racemase